jgi:hypothetical protein
LPLPIAFLASTYWSGLFPEQHRFHTDVDMAQVDLRVVDRHGRLVTGLTPDDLIVGTPQDIQAFSLVQRGGSTPAGAASATAALRSIP